MKFLPVQIIIMLVGFVYGMSDFKEYRLSSKASVKAVPTDIEKIEAGQPLPDVHILVGTHNAMYNKALYSYNKMWDSKYIERAPIDSMIYPIISSKQPWSVRISELAREYEKLEYIPMDIDMPEVTNVAFLVRSKQYKYTHEMPRQISYRHTQVRGMVVNDVAPLTADEREQLQILLPNVDLDQCYILEHERVPTDMAELYDKFVWGGLIFSAGFIWFILPYVISFLHNQGILKEKEEEAPKKEFTGW